MKTYLNIFIGLVVVFSFSLGFMPLGAMAQETGMEPAPTTAPTTAPTMPPAPPPEQAPVPPPPPTPPPEPTRVEPPRMPPPPQGQNSKSNHISPQIFESETESFEEDSEQQDFVDPREIKDALRQLKDVKKEIQRTLKKAQKTNNFTNEVTELNALLSEVAQFSESIGGADGSNQREAIQEFYDAQLWDRFNDIRVKIEFPQEIKNIEKELKRVEKLLSSKKFSIESVDMNMVRSKVEEIKNAISEARQHFNNGDLEDASEALSVIYEGSHPGEIFGVLQQLREIDKRLKSFKGEVRSIFQEALQPVFEAMNAGDFREANMLLNDIQRELWNLFGKVKSRSSGLSDEMRQKLRNLEQQLENKQQQIEIQNSSGEQSINYDIYKTFRQASTLESMLNWFR